MTVLRVRGLTKRYGGLTAVIGVDLEVHTGEVVGLIGPNGAGKSTIFAMITGAVKPTSGRVEVDDVDLTGRRPHRVARAGVVRTFQAINLFEELSVLDNVVVGSYRRYPSRFLASLFVPRSQSDAERESYARAILAQVGLAELGHQATANLSLGHKRLLNVAVALAANPKFVLLDEPLAGLAGSEQAELLGIVRELRGRGLGVMLVEHNVRAVMAVADRIVVLNFGEKLAEGTPQEVQRDERVREVYLGLGAR